MDDFSYEQNSDESLINVPKGYLKKLIDERKAKDIYNEKKIKVLEERIHNNAGENINNINMNNNNIKKNTMRNNQSSELSVEIDNNKYTELEDRKNKDTKIIMLNTDNLIAKPKPELYDVSHNNNPPTKNNNEEKDVEASTTIKSLFVKKRNCNSVEKKDIKKNDGEEKQAVKFEQQKDVKNIKKKSELSSSNLSSFSSSEIDENDIMTIQTEDEITKTNKRLTNEMKNLEKNMQKQMKNGEVDKTMLNRVNFIMTSMQYLDKLKKNKRNF